MTGPYYFLRSVYNVGNLDTRLTTPSSAPYRAVEARSDGGWGKEGAAAKPDPKAKPSKWNTPEFLFYLLVFVTTVPYMFWVAYAVSRRMHLAPPILLPVHLLRATRP